MSSTLRLRLAVMGLVVLLLQVSTVFAQVRREIHIPDILDSKTLKCDFHMHTVFSDGLVWPTVRVDEAWQEGLDAIAITDHIEYQPHKKDVPTSHNRSYEIALPRAKELGMLLIRAAEITRATPPGHFNALFLQDAKPLDTNDLLDAMAAADKQGAFIWWNHPGWKPERKGWFDIHTTLYERKYLRGIEVVNGGSYDPEAHEWALSKNLTFLGNTDIHRPMTLVFAKDKNVPAIKEALLAGRTAIWLENKLIGRKEYVQALLLGAVQVTNMERDGKKTVRFTIRNDSDLPIELQREGKLGPKELNLPGNTSARVRVDVKDSEEPTELVYMATNFLVAPEKGLPVKFLILGGSDLSVKVQ